MQLSQLLLKHKIVIPQHTLNFCKLGLKEMASSVDPVHDISHVNRLFGWYDKYLTDNRKKPSLIKHEVLILAIAWHEVWKAKRNPKRLITFLLDQFREGIASSRLFVSKAKTLQFSPELIKAVAYAIRKHSSFQIIPSKTLEAKLLWDFDVLDMWNFDRVYNARDNFFLMKKKLYLKGFEEYMRMNNGSSLHTNWARLQQKEAEAGFFAKMKSAHLKGY